ncbi:hypothetical protein CBM2615_A160023 [Cupriavidus taiwanensis]|uniref:Uncharacterized protein n=1 Tax=Cupriavidus taiwanensis TaxID=164546 RepID=A0A375DWV4_9BURK|nr:hypothetical protein CBM2615_A160023 [Cupriavidus taiwanensis]SOZ54507.1 hypothetical protein CBM2613_A160023 [Cupriavidus taiwanensis]SPA04299.1 hypothetical protein CBM2625_A120023 [Cupriavidus taiwanensis]
MVRRRPATPAGLNWRRLHRNEAPCLVFCIGTCETVPWPHSRGEPPVVPIVLAYDAFEAYRRGACCPAVCALQK